MKLYKFASGEVINIDLIKEKIVSIKTESAFGTSLVNVHIQGEGILTFEFDDDQVAREEMKKLIFYLETYC